MLCVALTPASLEDVFTADLTGADCVEVRLDYMKDPPQSLQASWLRLNVPVIATCRRVERGGRFTGTIEQEHQLLQAAARNGAAYVDIDYRDARPVEGARLIASYHNFDETPSDVERHLDAACEGPAQIGKVATMVQSWADNHRLLRMIEKPRAKPVIVTGMGEIGQITRLAGPSRGSFLTYAATTQRSGEASAPGQLSLHEMRNVYRIHRIHRSTKLLGVVGNRVGHSLGPVIHNRAFEQAGVDFAYLRFPVFDVADFFEHAREIGIHGFSVTIPHKIAVLPYLAACSPEAVEVGAVNTVTHADGYWLADNTDVHGVRAALASVNFDPAGKRVVILGTGGASKAASVAVQGAASVIALPRAELRNADRHPCDLLINATPVGMIPAIDESPIEGPIHADVVLDMVYIPAMTKLLTLAREQGKTIIPGSAMFYAQAARQFEIWTGQTPPAGAYAS